MLYPYHIPTYLSTYTGSISHRLHCPGNIEQNRLPSFPLSLCQGGGAFLFSANMVIRRLILYHRYLYRFRANRCWEQKALRYLDISFVFGFSLCFNGEWDALFDTPAWITFDASGVIFVVQSIESMKGWSIR